MFTPENRTDIVTGLIAALPSNIKAAAVPKLRQLTTDDTFLEDLFAVVTGGDAPKKMGPFSPKETAALYAVAPDVFDRVTASTATDTSDTVSTGWRGDFDQLLTDLQGLPHVQGSVFADSLGAHPESRVQVLALARGTSIPGVMVCPELKGKLGDGSVRNAILSCLQRHVNAAPVAEAK